MAEYQPDAWIPVRIETEGRPIVYKIMASWYGGFARGDRWKLSSGVLSVTNDDGVLTIPQSSGSVYICNGEPHMSNTIMNVLHSYQKEYEDLATFTAMSKAELLEVFK